MADKIQIVILAAGLGKRMGDQSLPKALAPLRNRPIISFLLDAVKESGVCKRPLIVVGKMAEKVQAALGSDYDYVLQPQPLGTGHAVMCAQPVLENQAKDIFVLYADQPLLKAVTINQLVDLHLATGNVLTMGTVRLSDFEDWRAGFFDFGRISRDQAGQVVGIVERKDATPEQLKIQEVNPGYYCFKAEWLWSHLKQLGNNNSQSEYYLTDLVGLACQEKQTIATLNIDAQEALGVNNPEQLKLVESLLN